LTARLVPEKLLGSYNVDFLPCLAFVVKRWPMPVEILTGVVIGAAIASPTVRKTVRQGLVRGLAGVLMTYDKAVALARGVGQAAQQTETAPAPSQPSDAGPAEPLAVKVCTESTAATGNGCATAAASPAK
jgi:hypothetical protein